MKKQDLLKHLERWLKFESCVDRDGNISPSKMAIDIVHYHFIIKNTYTNRIEDVRLDQQGGILIYLESTNPDYSFLIHVVMDGVIDYYEVHSSGNIEKTRMRLKTQDKGFGTDKYQF